MNGEVWLFIVHNKGMTWTRAFFPENIHTPSDLVHYLRRGGKVVSDWMSIPDRITWSPRVIGMTVLANIPEKAF
jgi:hypothetical protein